MVKNKIKGEELIPSSYDTIGSIIILDIPKGLEKKKKLIGEALLKMHPSVKTVAMRTAVHKGLYRVRAIKVVAGEKKTETVYTESGCRLMLDPAKVYFSPRLSNERLRVANQVEKGEEVLVMFSGVAPYCCVIAKRGLAKKVVGIEINPAAHKYAAANVKINKLEGKVEVYKGDVHKILPKLKIKFDRVVMPLPKTAEKFLKVALKYAKKNSVVHYYHFAEEAKVDVECDKIIEIIKKLGRKCKILRVVKAGQHAPRAWRYCFDVRLD